MIFKNYLGVSFNNVYKMVDSSGHLTSMINQSEISLSLLFQCYRPLMISTSLRNQIRDLFLRTKRPDMVYNVN